MRAKEEEDETKTIFDLRVIDLEMNVIMRELSLSNKISY